MPRRGSLSPEILEKSLCLRENTYYSNSSMLTLAKQELEVMKLIWRSESGTATVRDVYEALRERRTIAYTSVMSTMRTLEQKGFLTKWEDGRAYVYQPTRAKEQVVLGLVEDFVGRVFNGSGEALVVHLIKQLDLSSQNLKEIEKAIEASE